MADFEVNRRLKKVITEVYKMTPHKFSVRYDDSGGVKTSQVIRERNGLSNNLLEEILRAYPEINRSWLLTGEGEMIKNASSSQIVSEPKVHFQSKKFTTDDIIGKLVETNSLLVVTNSKLADQSEKIITALKEMTSTNAELVKIINATKQESGELINGAAKTA